MLDLEVPLFGCQAAHNVNPNRLTVGKHHAGFGMISLPHDHDIMREDPHACILTSASKQRLPNASGTCKLRKLAQEVCCPSSIMSRRLPCMLKDQ